MCGKLEIKHDRQKFIYPMARIGCIGGGTQPERVKVLLDNPKEQKKKIRETAGGCGGP